MSESKSWNLPSRLDCWARLQAAGPPEWVYGHARAVEGLAAAMANHEPTVNRHLILTGALLHDIGRSITQDVRHAHLGADMIRDEMPSDIVDIVERHTGAGITPDEAAALALPPRNYMPTTMEQKIVAHADNLFSGSKRLTLSDLETKYKDRGLLPAWDRINQLHAELESHLGLHLDDLPAAELPAPTGA